VHMR